MSAKTETSPFKPTLFPVLFEALHGKAVSRTLTNIFWRGRIKLSGNILDIGGGSPGSHYRFLEKDENTTFKVVDIISRQGTDFKLDIAKDNVPLPEGSQDFVLMFNILEHLYAHGKALAEVRRLLRSRGKLIGIIPFLVNVHPGPT